MTGDRQAQNAQNQTQLSPFFRAQHVPAGPLDHGAPGQAQGAGPAPSLDPKHHRFRRIVLSEWNKRSICSCILLAGPGTE